MIDRVLMTTDTVGGVWSYCMELATELSAKGVKLLLATMGDPVSQDQLREAGEIPGLEVRESGFKLEWMEEPWCEVDQAGDWLLGLEREFKPDVVHLNGYCHGDLPWKSPTVVVAHSCVLSWWRAVLREDVPDSWSEYRDRVARGLHAASFVVAPTRAMLDCAETHYGPLQQAKVIPNARRSERFKPAHRKQPFVLSAGRLWDRAKNVHALDKAAAKIEWPVYIAGPGGDFENSMPLGRLSAPVIARWFAQASIYALPARYEPFGLSVLEAGLAGCALVLGDIPSLRENWEGVAHFVDPADSEALAESVNRLVRDPVGLATAGARARERALEFSPKRMGDSYFELYRSLVSSQIYLSHHMGEPLPKAAGGELR